MSWGRVDDSLHSHPKVIDAGLEAMGLWVRALSFACQYLTDGHVRRSHALQLVGSPEILSRLSGDLVRAGLWDVHPDGDGWSVHDFLDYNLSREKVLADREARRIGGQKGAANRKAKGGYVSAGEGPPMGLPIAPPMGLPIASPIGRRDAPVPSRPVPSQREGEPARSPVQTENSPAVRLIADRRIVANATDDGCDGFGVAAWVDGVKRGAGQPAFFLSRGRPTVVVVEAILAHCPDPNNREAFARAKGEAWSRDRKEQQKTLNPFDFLDWLNSGEPDRKSGVRKALDDDMSEAEKAIEERKERRAAGRLLAGKQQ